MYVLATHTPIHEMCVQMNGTNTIILCVLCSMFYVICSVFYLCGCILVLWRVAKPWGL